MWRKKKKKKRSFISIFRLYLLSRCCCFLSLTVVVCMFVLSLYVYSALTFSFCCFRKTLFFCLYLLISYFTKSCSSSFLISSKTNKNFTCIAKTYIYIYSEWMQFIVILKFYYTLFEQTSSKKVKVRYYQYTSQQNKDNTKCTGEKIERHQASTRRECCSNRSLAISFNVVVFS